MKTNIDNVPMGQCSLCGGIVSTPKIWLGVNRAVPTCESCGASVDIASTLPRMPMIQVKVGAPGIFDDTQFTAPMTTKKVG